MQRFAVPFLALALSAPAAGQRIEWNLVTEPVADVGQSGHDPGTFWGYHQSIIVRSGEHVYAALMDSRGPGFDRQMRIHVRDPETGWRVAYVTPDGTEMNQPPNLVVDGDGRVHVTFQLDQRLRYGSWMPGQDIAAIAWQRPTIGNGYSEHYPYGSVAVNAAGELVDERAGAGHHAAAWDGRTAGGDLAATGVYVARLRIGDRVEARKVALVR